MKIAVFTESGYVGKVPRNFTNCRTEYAWWIAMDATHFPLFQISLYDINLHKQLEMGEFDIGIIILPKKNIHALMGNRTIDTIKKYCKKVATMQEGPNWYYQDYSMKEQIWFYNTLTSMDFLLCHNVCDKYYYSGLTQKPTYVLQSLMITDNIKLHAIKDKKVIIGGNMVSWYSGFDSYIVAQEYSDDIWAPSMGRKIPDEKSLDIKHLQYMDWAEWITELSRYEIGVHLMRTIAAGTFALNCSYLGIPCVGYSLLDTQRILHPSTTIFQLESLEYARHKINKLKDPHYYKQCSENTKKLYKTHYSEKIWLERWNEILLQEVM